MNSYSVEANPSINMHSDAGSMSKIDLSSSEMFPELPKSANISPSIPVLTMPPGLASNGVIRSQLASPTNTTNVSQVYTLPFEQQRRFKDFGDRTTLSDHCRQVMNSIPVTIEATTSVHTRAITFLIGGPELAVGQARRMLWSRLAETLTIDMPVAKEHLKILIGPSGKTLRRIGEETGAKIKIPRAEEFEGLVYVTGDAESVMAAKLCIGNLLYDKTNKKMESIVIEKHISYFLVGSTGSNTKVKELCGRLGVRINVVSLPSGHISLSISGDREKVEDAVESLSNQISSLEHEIKHVTTSVPKPLHRFIVGAKASTLHSIMDASSCFVAVPMLEDASEQVVIYGAQTNLVKGLSKILEKTEGLDAQMLPLPKYGRAYLAYRNHQTMRRIENELGLFVYLSEEHIELVGKLENIQMGVSELKHILRPVVDGNVVLVKAEPKQYKHVIGKHGQTLQKIMSEFRVQLIIPDEKDSLLAGYIIIIGDSSDKTVSAKKHIEEMLASLEDNIATELVIDTKFYGQLIGAQGEAIKRFRKRHPLVSVNFEDGGRVTLRGPSKDAQLAKEQLLAQVQEIKHESIMTSYTVTLDIKKEWKPFLETDGKIEGGLVRIGRDHEVWLKIEDDRLLVRGYKKNVDVAMSIIARHLDQLGHQITETLYVDPKYYARLIGRGGGQLAALREATSCQIIVPKGRAPADVVLRGTIDAIAAAKHAIKELVGNQT